MRKFAGLIALAGVLLLSGIARADHDASHVQSRLLANVTSISPGKTFLLGVEFKIDPGWHIYWKNPGEAGAATKIKFTASEGFTVGEMRYAVPSEIDQPGMVYYGYENVVVLTVEVTAPKDLPKDFSGKFSADASWLVCQDVCLPGKQTLEMTLPAGDALPANQELFDTWTAQVPVEANASADVARVESSDKANDEFEIAIDWKSSAPKSVQFFPGLLDGYNIRNVKVRSDGERTTITFAAEAMAGQKPAATTLAVVVGYVDKDGRHRGFSTSVNLPAK